MLRKRHRKKNNPTRDGASSRTPVKDPALQDLFPNADLDANRILWFKAGRLFKFNGTMAEWSKALPC
ncbi:MAG: hypothetical protein ACK5JP_10420 [Akkermansiaceae bacterium]